MVSGTSGEVDSFRPKRNLIHGLVVGIFVIFWLAVSWRRWATLEVDFGRELYVPWRLSEGDLLYRDVEDFYGPFSQYFNAALFRIFGPGLMVLVGANLAIFLAILAMLYSILRRAWDANAALVGTVVFIAIFGFGNYLYPGNYNYLAPYSHEATHGMLVLLALVWVLSGWCRQPTIAASFWAGLLFGLTLVLKPEIMLSAAVVTALSVHLCSRKVGSRAYDSAAGWTLGATIPTVAFAAFFSLDVPFATALSYASRAWLNVIATSRFVSDPAQLRFLGFDDPWSGLLHHLFATAIAGTILALFVWCCGRIPRAKSGLWVGLLAAAIVSTLGFSMPAIFWLTSGRALLGLILCYLFFLGWNSTRSHTASELELAGQTRFLIAALAAILMSRMVLNGRIYQFGFYQAAIAGTLVPSILVGEAYRFVGPNRAARLIFFGGMAGALIPGILKLAKVSVTNYQAMTVPIEAGKDHHLVPPPSKIGSTVMISRIARILRQMPRGQTLLVLPEGQGLNYLARMRSPLAPFFFYSASTERGRETQLVRQLEEKPPEWVVLIARDLTEYGIRRYGESPGHGKELLAWLNSNYASCGKIGTDPLGNKFAAIELFSRNYPPVAVPPAIDTSVELER
jgi:hypothetical protein